MPPNHLVVVCGHGIWLGGPAKGHDEAEWLIEAYKAGETPTFVAHIRAGLQVLADDADAVVAFSGGPTRCETPLSEGRSYANLAAANDYFGLLGGEGDDGDDSERGRARHPFSPRPLHRRVLVEEQALDSYCNILFSLLAFWRHAGGAWPRRLTLVSHAFKRTRLVDGHCGPDALAFRPRDRIAFIGIDPPNLPAAWGGSGGGGGGQDTATATATATATGEAKEQAMQGAHAVLDHWAADPHGTGPLLAGKRRARNPWGVDQRLFASDAERQRSGLRTRVVGASGGLEALGGGIGAMEALADDSPRPWNGGG